MTIKTIKRGDVFFAELSPEGGLRLVLIAQTNVGNNFSPTVIAIPIKKIITDIDQYESKKDIKVELCILIS